MPDSDPLLHSIFANRYELLEELGRGGFAVVYRARDLALGRDVAVKILRVELLTQTAVRRFTLEMQVTAKLEHPNILRVYDTGTWNDRMYYVMECVRGKTVEDRLAAEGAFSIDEALEIICAVGRALGFAHDNGVIHRDVKPSNILIGTSGAVLGDFGIARLIGDGISETITSTGFAVGTVQYMSPEQLLADPKIDARSDQYGLALVCYEMFTGVRPHVASSLEALRALRSTPSLVSVRVHRPTVPPRIDDAIRRALSPAPADRFRHMNDFVAALSEGDAPPMASHADDIATAAPELDNRDHLAEGRAVRSRTATLAGALLLLGASGIIALLIGQRLSAAASRRPAVGDVPTVALVESSSGLDSVFAARVNEELELWTDVPTRPAVRSTTATPDETSAMRDGAARAAVTILLRPAIAQTTDSMRWTLTVYDTRVSRLYRVSRVRGKSSSLDEPTLRDMVARVLVGALADSAPGFAGLPDRSVRAANTYASAWHLLHIGAFDSAKTAFAAAAEASPAFAEPHWWAAQIAAWTSPKNPAAWRDGARRALAIHGALHDTDSILVAALLALADDPPASCAKYRLATERAPDSFVGWYGLGQCQELDSAVVRDADVPGGWRFRSSHWSALAAYEEAMDRLPSEGMASLFVRVVRITYARGNYVRSGVALLPDTGQFFAIPSLRADTLELLPVPRSRFVGTSAVPESFNKALQRARKEFLEVTARWVARAPTSSEGWFYRAYALELVGAFDSPDGPLNSAAAALRRADSLNTDDGLRARIDAARVRVAVRRGAFDDAKQLATAAIGRRGPVTAQVALLRAPLAAFLSDVDATISMLRIAASPTNAAERRLLPPWAANTLPPWLADSVRAFGVRAILGVCDGLAPRRAALDSAFRQYVPAADLAESRRVLLRDVYRAAVPCLGPSLLREFPPENPLDEAIAAIDAGNLPRAREVLDQLDRRRRGVSLSTVTEDALLAEAWIRTHAGDADTGSLLLRANMNDLASISAFTFDEIPQAAALTRIHRLVFGR